MVDPAAILTRPVFIGSEIYRRSSYGPKHPLAIPRVSTAIDLCRALGWLPDTVYVDSPVAARAALARFHDPAYIAALAEAERTLRVAPEDRERFNLGRVENPIFAQMFSRPATAAGASLCAADMLLRVHHDAAARGTAARRRPAIVYSPAGGTHHGRPDRASGFCYFNDPVLAILRLLDGGLARVLYVDFDAHHGDGVQDAFADEPRVLTISVHEAGRWPHTGAADERCGGGAINLPVPAGFNDSELAALVEAVIMPAGWAFGAEAVVVQCGADALADDPLSKLALSNRALWRAVAAMVPLAPLALVLGGGGYNPWSVGRAWAGVWATLNGFAVPARLPAAAEAVLRGLTWHRAAGRHPPEHWFTTLADPSADGPVRAAVAAVIDDARINDTRTGMPARPALRCDPSSLDKLGMRKLKVRASR